MRLLQILFSILWCMGYIGNGILFLYTEWTYLRQNFVQLFNPILQLEVIGALLINQLFWIFLGMAVVGYYTTKIIEKKLERHNQQSEIKVDQVALKSSNISLPSSVQQVSEQVNDLAPEYVGKYVKLLEWAIQSSQKVHFSYEKYDGEKSNRTVTPIGFKTVEKTLCLEGYCNLRRARRTFAIKRMSGIRIVSSDEVIYKPQPSSEDIPTQSSSINSKNQVTQKRPYLKYSFEEIERIANVEWNNIQSLNEIHHELEFRSRKKAQALRECITQRLTQLQSLQFVWPSTTAASGSQNLSSDVFKYEEGLLKQYGYKVGANGLPESQRRQILDSIFLQSLSFVNDPNYLREWGEPNTAKRLQKIAESIAAFTRNTKRRNMNSFSKAIQDWEDDLAYLKRTYYGNFYFQWPRTGISGS